MEQTLYLNPLIISKQQQVDIIKKYSYTIRARGFFALTPIEIALYLNTKRNMKKVIKNPSFVYLFFSMGFSNGSFAGVASILSFMLLPFGFTSG